jgi:hypothetical protein
VSSDDNHAAVLRSIVIFGLEVVTVVYVPAAMVVAAVIVLIDGTPPPLLAAQVPSFLRNPEHDPDAHKPTISG